MISLYSASRPSSGSIGLVIHSRE
jgi:hypothetical protein